MDRAGLSGRFLKSYRKILFKTVVLRISGVVSLSPIYVVCLLLLHRVNIYNLFLVFDRRQGGRVTTIDMFPGVEISRFRATVGQRESLHSLGVY